MVKSEIIEATKQALQEFKDSQDDMSIQITGCDIKCTLEYELNDRNGIKRLSLKDYCKKININHRVIYEILYDLGWIEKLSSANIVITPLGFPEINGIGIVEFPVMTTISGSLYVDDTHEKFRDFFGKIEAHDLYNTIGQYNDEMKERKLVFSRNEKKIAEDLGIEIKEQKRIKE